MSVIWIIIYGIIYSFSEKISKSFGESHILTVFAIMLYIAILYIFLRKQKRLSVYGLCFPKYWRKKDIGWLMPLLTFSLVNIYLQVNNQTMLQNSWIMFILMLFTVFLEELLFRGYLLVYLFEKCGIDNKWIGMIISSVLFGMFHIVNLFQGADILYTMIQMLCACGIGLCLCVLVSKYKSIFPGTIIHYLINITSFDIGKSNYIVLSCFLILSILYIFYACLLNRKLITVQ
jgi:membrane protease YdiL (CAAX protease family)